MKFNLAKAYLIAPAALMLLAIAVPAAKADILEDVAVLGSSECFAGCGETDFFQSTQPSTPTVLGNVLFTFVSDFDVYLTDANSGLVVDHVFADEGLGNHDAIYFSNLAVTTDASIGGACPNPSDCVAITGGVQDISSLVLAQDPNAGQGSFSLTVQSLESTTPEPATNALLLAGVGLVALLARRRKAVA
jgi:hypothetical protein